MTPWRSALLSENHDLGSFSCGVESLDNWLREQAWRAHRSDTARTFVWTATDANVVSAYYAIAPTQVHRADVGRAMSGGVTTIPGYLLARLALDRRLHGQGLGGQLLLDAIERIVQAAENAGGRLIVVDAIDDAAADFYTHHDFRSVSGNPRRLIMKVATARAALIAASTAMGDEVVRAG